MKNKKKIEPICKNCMLYNHQDQHCTVIVLYEGQKIYPPTDPDTRCLFEDEYEYVDEQGNTGKWKPEVQEIRMWCENPVTGEKSDHGIVKIEAPESYFLKKNTGFRE